MIKNNLMQLIQIDKISYTSAQHFALWNSMLGSRPFMVIVYIFGALLLVNCGAMVYLIKIDFNY